MSHFCVSSDVSLNEMLMSAAVPHTNTLLKSLLLAAAFANCVTPKNVH